METFLATRAFYRRNGYDEEARIRDFYGPGEDKIVFWKALQLPIGEAEEATSPGGDARVS